MQPVQGIWHPLTIISLVAFGLYFMHFVIVPSLPGFRQQVLPSPFGLNSNLFPTHGITEIQDHEEVRVIPSSSNPEDDGSLLIEESPTIIGGKRQKQEGENKRRKGPNVQDDDDPLMLVAQEEGVEQNGSTDSDDDNLSFQIKDAGGWLASEEPINVDMESELHLNAKMQEKGKEVEGGGEKEEIGAGFGILSPIGKFRVGNELWLPEVAAHLAESSSWLPIRIPEYFSNNPCSSNCSGQGVCNHQLGKCRCFLGYTGAACNLEAPVECNLKRVNDDDGYYGPWIPSMCSGTCDKRIGFCYCGEDTKYPKRPVAEQCGFPKIAGADWLFNWNERDSNVFVNGSTGPGWCNMDPKEFIAKRLQKKKECYCIYDGTMGNLCEIPVQCSCLNQCSGNGFCQGGFCACTEGWHGIDCSVPSQVASMKTWPTWLSNDIVNISDYLSEALDHESTKVIVERYRPLIYIYDLPPAFNSLLMEGRHFKLQCVTRIYDEQNSTFWTDQLYGAESALLESLLASKHRTTNAEEADFFYVPVLGACATIRAGDTPHMDMKDKYLGLRTYFAGDLYKKAYEHIKSKYPYWDRLGGRDHIWIFTWDEGACISPKEIWSSMMLVHWGNTNSKYNYSTTQYPSDNWGMVPIDWRGNHPCYDPKKDLVLPSWKNPNPYLLEMRLWSRKIEQRPNLFYFRGNLGNKYQKGRPEPEYSMGIRQRVAEEFGTDPNVEGHVGRQSAPDVKVFGAHSDNYSLELASSRFCGVFPGDGWSGRMEDSILHGCIPVIIQDGVHLPFENVLDYSKFVVSVSEDELPQMVDILRSIPKNTVEAMQSKIQTIWQRFTYHNAIQLEADRQELIMGKSHKEVGFHPPTWVTEYKKLTDDDAFATFIQVLHYKLLQRTAKAKDIQNTNRVAGLNYPHHR